MKYLSWKPNYSDDTVLKDAYQDMKSFVIAESSDIPFIIQLFENPKYDFLRLGRLKGSIDLFGHDILHILLKQDMSLMGEAYVIGFTMGTSKKLKILILKFLNLFQNISILKVINLILIILKDSKKL